MPNGGLYAPLKSPISSKLLPGSKAKISSEHLTIWLKAFVVGPKLNNTNLGTIITSWLPKQMIFVIAHRLLVLIIYIFHNPDDREI